MDLDSVSVNKHAKRGLDQYPAILTSNLVTKPYILLNWGNGGRGRRAGEGRGGGRVNVSKPHPFFVGRRKILHFSRVNIDYWCSLHNSPTQLNYKLIKNLSKEGKHNQW